MIQHYHNPVGCVPQEFVRLLQSFVRQAMMLDVCSLYRLLVLLFLRQIRLRMFEGMVLFLCWSFYVPAFLEGCGAGLMPCPVVVIR